MKTEPELGAGSVAPVCRCAIYTRKSTEEGLNQPFNTLEAQREAAEAYILSQRHTCLLNSNRKSIRHCTVFQTRSK
jgi:hypothetical protein